MRDGVYTGRSTAGGTLKARHEGLFLVGTILEPGRPPEKFRITDLSQVYGYSIPSGRSDRYTAIVSRHGTLIYGRGGNVRGGTANRNLLAFDIQPSAIPTPGFFFGKVGFERDVVGIQLDLLDAQGRRGVRVYVSDSEPEPAGDVQWFAGQANANTVDLVSASGDARVQLTLDDDIITGVITFPGRRVRPLFALPAGEGAGIYDVTVFADGTFMGVSEQGAILQGVQDGLIVRLVITTPDGRRFEEPPSDLTRTLGYPEPGNQPDTYVAVVAPHGRFVFGRSGNVRGGFSGRNIIGLDKKC